MNNKVSVITASYNAERFIGETIESVLNQLYIDLELIIVDDCSTDNTEKVICKYMEKDKRIKFYKLEKNYGAAVARNIGIQKSSGRFISFIDSDDLWDRDKLYKQINFMKDNNYGFSFTSYRLMKEDGELTGKEVIVPEYVTYNDLLKNTVIGCLTVVIDRTIIGNFSMPLVRAGQDTATWLSILKKGHIAYGVKEVLASYRFVSGSISSNKIKALKRTWNTYRNLEKLNIVNASYCFACYLLNAVKKRV